MDHLGPLIVFAAISSGTPGPNNTLLWASGTAFGFRRTFPHVLGTAVGLGGMAIAVAAGLGALITAFPPLAVAMKIAGSVYLLYLAWQVAGAGALNQTTMARPLGILQAAGFQVINPKAWIFALGAVTTFRPPNLPLVAGSLLVAVTMMIVVIPMASLWAAAGDGIGRLIESERSRRIGSLVLAVILVLTVVTVWLEP